MYYTPSLSQVFFSPLAMLLPLLGLIVVLACGLALYFLFVRKTPEKPLSHALAWLHDALNFRTLFTEKLLRVLYCITVCGLILASVDLLFSNFIGAVLLFVIGNVAARIGFEFALLLLILCRNTQEINRKMGPLPTVPQQPTQPPAAPAQSPAQPPVPPQADDSAL